MYFSVFQYYNNNDSILLKEKEEKEDNGEKEEPIVCLICLEHSNSVLKFKNIIPNYNGCVCDGNYHTSCLYKWFDLHNSCPICRVDIHYIAYKDNIEFAKKNATTFKNY